MLKLILLFINILLFLNAPSHGQHSYAGWGKKIITNKVCVGQCFSYSIPRTIPEIPGDRMLHYCDSCRPVNFTWEKISLEINEPDLNTEEKSMDILVELIHDCSCQSCYGSNSYGGYTEEKSQEFAEVNQIPSDIIMEL
ncbi:unnamed protein product [Gordionus sp. m RMFG-2023]|uniref:neuroblastoma suppressor of tumorigenicity 1-like isoform X2 n=1 Tax=Gordionus sp. m RMFG-2023 TaxID=3053472 RepID=UPI0030E4BE52